MSDNASTLLSLSGVGKTFKTPDGAFRAVDDVSLRIAAGERVGLIGSSGSGKSTLANIVVGLDPASEGEGSMAGVDLQLTSRPGKRSQEAKAAYLDMQMIFQHPASSFSNRMKVETAVAEGIAYRPGYNKAEARSRVLECLEQVRLPRDYADKRIWQLSGGECQRVAIARAIISRPRLLVCDEPTSALDVTTQAGIINLLADLCDEYSMGCLFVSHDLALVRAFCQRIYVMDTGRIVEEGSAETVFNQPQSDAAKRLLTSVVTI